MSQAVNSVCIIVQKEKVQGQLASKPSPHTFVQFTLFISSASTLSVLSSETAFTTRASIHGSRDHHHLTMLPSPCTTMYDNKASSQAVTPTEEVKNRDKHMLLARADKARSSARGHPETRSRVRHVPHSISRGSPSVRSPSEAQKSDVR